MDPEQLQTLFSIKYYIDVTSHDFLLASYYRYFILLDPILSYLMLHSILSCVHLIYIMLFYRVSSSLALPYVTSPSLISFY